MLKLAPPCSAFRIMVWDYQRNTIRKGKEIEWNNKRGIKITISRLVSFAAVIRVVTHRSSPLTTAHSSAAFLSLCYWEPITCMSLLAAPKSYFSLQLPTKTRFPENGSLLLIGQFGERNVELEWAAVSGEDRCATTLNGCEGDSRWEPVND